MAEQSIVFNRDSKSNPEELGAFLEFSVTDQDMEHFEHRVPFSGGDELAKIMKFYLEEKWALLFPEHWNPENIEECVLEGVFLMGRQEKGRFSTHWTDGYKKHTTIFNEKALLNESAEKLLKIRSIVLS